MGLHKIFKLFAFLSLCLFAMFSSMYDTLQRSNNVQQKTISGENDYTINKSITSAVRVISEFSVEGAGEIISTSSGTYFAHNGVDYVITAGHSLIGDCESTQVIADDYAFNCLAVVSIDLFKDIGIFEVEKIFNRDPLIITDILSGHEIPSNIGIHEQVIYTGYPQGMGPFTFDGKVVSHGTPNEIFFVHSYAWSGSSGSGVFNSNGSMVGVISAVSVANSEYGVDVMEDLIIVTSIEIVDLQSVL